MSLDDLEVLKSLRNSRISSFLRSGVFQDLEVLISEELKVLKSLKTSGFSNF